MPSSLLRRTGALAAVSTALVVSVWTGGSASAITNPIQLTQGSCTGFFAERNVTLKNVDTVGAFITVANTPNDFSGTRWLPAGQTYSFSAAGGSTLHVYKFNPVTTQLSNWAITSGCPGTPRSLAREAARAQPAQPGAATRTLATATPSLSWSQGPCVYGPNGQTPLSTMTLSNQEAYRIFFAVSEGAPTYGFNYVLPIYEGFQLAPAGTANSSFTIYVYSGSTMHITLLNGNRQQYDIPVTSGQTCDPPPDNNGTVTDPVDTLPVSPTATLIYREGSCGSGGTTGYRTVYVRNSDDTPAYVAYNFQALTGGQPMATDYIRVGQENTYSVLANGTTALHMRRYNAGTTILDHSVTSC